MPRLKESESSLRGILRGDPADRPKSVKNEALESKTGDFRQNESPGDSFLTLFGVSARRFFLTF